MSGYHFFAIMSRMKYINRWSLMNNTRTENISEHSLSVAILAHALATIRNKRLNGNINAEHAAAIALFHDCTEIITGDLPTPIKYSSKTLRNAYADIEKEAAFQLLSSLPEYMRDEYEKLIVPQDDEKDIYRIVKAADRLSALIKCIEEEQTGSNEFRKAKEDILKSLEDYNMEEVNIFMSEFLPSYSLSLDEQNVEIN